MRLGILCWLLIALTTAARAEGPAVVAASADDLCAQDDACRQHSENAQNLSRVGKLSAALDEYQAAYNAIQIPVFLYNIARLYHRTGNSEQAAIFYQKYLAAGHNEDAEHRARAQEYLKQVDTFTPASKEGPISQTVSAETPKPLYKKWWFWTIGGIVAGTAIGLGVGLGTRSKGFPDDVMVYNPGF